jgi:hypothetical protein
MVDGPNGDEKAKTGMINVVYFLEFDASFLFEKVN